MKERSYEDNQFLTFLVGTEVFGIGILHVKEIKEFNGVTEIPMMPEFIKGVVNLRGNVVPIVDLKVRFGKKQSIITKRSCIIIVEVETEDKATVDIGVLVDSVYEVIDIPPTEIEPPPSFGSKIRIDFIGGIGKIDNSFVIILNINKVFSIQELSMLGDKVESSNRA